MLKNHSREKKITAFFLFIQAVYGELTFFKGKVDVLCSKIKPQLFK